MFGTSQARDLVEEWRCCQEQFPHCRLLQSCSTSSLPSTCRPTEMNDAVVSSHPRPDQSRWKATFLSRGENGMGLLVKIIRVVVYLLE